MKSLRYMYSLLEMALLMPWLGVDGYEEHLVQKDATWRLEQRVRKLEQRLDRDDAYLRESVEIEQSRSYD